MNHTRFRLTCAVFCCLNVLLVGPLSRPSALMAAPAPSPPAPKAAEATPATPPAASPPAKTATPTPAPSPPGLSTPAQPAKPAEPKQEPKPAETKPEAKPVAAKPEAAVPATVKAAEPKAAETKPLPTKVLDSRGQEVSYSLLAHPSIAERLKLTDPQRAKVAELLAERSEALAKADHKDRAKVAAEIEKKLAEVLTDAQRVEWAKRQPEPLLRFSYRFQRWVDVLEEVAKQAGLSLVLESPPPGTFNYSDSREYTPTEAIDLLNGVLVTKGFTLVRRDKMLVLIDLSEGIPEGLIPRVTLEELGDRGKFEMVSVLFPLKGRSAATVSAEIKPLLGPHGKVVPLPTTGQLLLTDTAGIMKVISAVIDSMPPASPSATNAAETPTLVVYPIKTADPQTVLKVLQTLLPAATFVLDPNTDQIHAYGGLSSQATVKSVIAQIQSNVPADKKPRLEQFIVNESAATELIRTLTAIVPSAKLSHDPKTGSLVVWATPSELETIKGIVEKLAGDGGPEHVRQFQVYRLTKAAPATAMTLLQELFPLAKIAVDTPTGNLVVIGTMAEQKAVQGILEQLQTEKTGPEALELKAYPATTADSANTVATLKTLYPHVQIVLDAKGQRLLVTANAADQTAIKASLDQIQAPTPKAQQQRFESYRLRGADPSTLVANLQALIPSAKVTVDRAAGTLVVFGTPAEHEMVQGALEKLGRGQGVEGTPQLEVYRLSKVEPTAVIATLQSLAPDAKLVVDAASKSVIALAVPADQKAIRNVLEQLQSGKPAADAPQLRFYPLSQTPSPAMIGVLQTLAPKAQVTLDSGGRRLTVVASPDDHQVLKSAIEQVDKAVQAEEKRKLVTYSVSPSQRTRFQAIAASLTAELPGIQVMANTEPGELVIWAKPSQQVVIADLLEQLKRQVPTSEKYQLVAYSIKAANPSSLLSVLKTLFPNAQITPDARSRRLIIWALPSEQEAIKSAIEKIDAAGPAETQEKLMVYPVSDIDPATAILSLQEALPDIKLISDAKAGTLLAWASPWEHQAIEKVLKQMQAGAEAQSKPKLVVYEVAEGDPVSMVAVLRALVPRAQVVADAKTRSIGATATPQEHELIRSAVEQMSKKEPPEKAHRLVTYTIDAGRRSAISTVISILGEQYPGARFTPGLERGHILAWARPDDQKRIQATIDELTKNTPPPELGYTLAFYAVESGGATAVNNAIGILKSLFPDAYLSASSEPGKLLAWARPKDQPRIAQIVKEVGQGEPPETAQRLEVYVLHSTSSSKGRRAQPPNAGVIAVLTTMFPEAHFSPGTDAMQVVVLARPADHVKIKAAVAELDKSEPPESAPRVLAYTLESAGPAGVTGAISLLQTLFPEAQFSAGSEPGSLVALARPDDHLAIKAAIAEMSKKEPPDKARKMVAYTLDAGGPYGFSYALTTLRTAFPDAQFSLGADPNRLVAWARPAEHQAIQIAIDEMSKKEPPDKAPSVATYRLDAIDATTAISLLRTTFADARFSVGADASSLIVWARPADQALIKKTLAEIETGGGPNDHRVLSVYPFKSHDVTALTQLLDPALRRGIQLVPDPTRSRLLVWADVKHQEVVKGVIEQFARETAKAGEPTSQVYRFEWADPRAAYTVLATLVPNAQIALDPVSHSLVVSAMPEDHAKIKATVAEMDRRDANGQSPRLEIYRFQSSDPANMMPVLQGLFRLYPEVRLSLDDANGAIVALATPAQQETIRSLVEKVEKQAAVDGNVSLEVYPLGDAHATSTLRMLTTLLDKESRKVQLSVEPYNNSLVAIARPEQQKVIRAALEQIKPEERTLEVIQLDMVDATTAQLAIERLFSDGGYTYNSSAPGVDIDSTTQQVFVRATAKQHEKIRELLIRMGETSLAQPSGTDTRRSRQIPFDGDLNAAVEEIKRVWPQLRPNPIQVVTPPQVLIRQRPPEPGQQPIQPAAGPEQAPGKPLPKNEIRPPTAQRSSDSPTPAPGGAAAAAKPVIVVPGEGSVTITSDDPAALNQFEMLLRAMSRQRGTVGRNYNVYLLRNASASSVAATLQQVFRVLPGRAGRRTAASAASVVVVPDERLNAIVAYANRTDRNTIENLIKVLDTAEMPETLDADRLQLIPIKNTSAEKIVQSLKTMFKSYVDGFSVEETTNSVVVMAAPQTVEEIKRVANLLDEAAGGKASREVEIVPLRKLKSAQVEKALQTILKTPPPRSSRSRSAGGR